MNPKSVRELQTNEVLRKRLAKYIALHCFRNTVMLENLHSGEVPISESGDYTDVRVITPAGEIPWRELSRFDNHEMKAVMIEVVNHCYQLLTILFSTRVAGDILLEGLAARDCVPMWNDPDWTWETDHEPQYFRDSETKGLIAARKAKKRKVNKVRRRSGRKK